MSTTTLFFELLIIGTQTSIAVAALIVAFADRGSLISVLGSAQPWANPLGVVLVGVLYTVGLIMDRVCDGLLIIAKPLLYKRPKKALMKISWVSETMREANADYKILVLAHEQKAVQYLEYIRSRLRIVRATLLNVFINAVALTVAVAHAGHPETRATTISWIWGIGSVLVVITYFAWAMLQSTYEDRHQQAVCLLQEKLVKGAGE